jgi:hypothetical protein
MTRRLITAAAVVMAFAAATACAEAAPHGDPGTCRAGFGECVTIPPDQYPDGCRPNGVALQALDQGAVMLGTARRDLLRGGPGNDNIIGYEKPDCVFGQGDSDMVDGRRGDDWVRGDDGIDVVQGGLADDLVQGGKAGDGVEGGGGADSLHGGPGPDIIAGNQGRDLIVDTKGHNEIDCGPGVDKVVTNRQSKVWANCEHITRR